MGTKGLLRLAASTSTSYDGFHNLGYFVERLASICRISISYNSSTSWRFLKLDQIFGNLPNSVLTNGGVLDENNTLGT